MASVSLSGNDTVIINNRVFADYADQNYAELTFPNDIAAVKTGKNGNSIYSLNETGNQSEVVIRLLRGSPDDKYLNGILSVQKKNFAAFVLMTGEFTKFIGDGLGGIQKDKYNMSGGIISRQVDGKASAEGDTEQSVAIWRLKFANSPRSIT